MPSPDPIEQMLGEQFVRSICAIFLPPLAVRWERGSWDRFVWGNLGLTLLLWLPGVLHAWRVIWLVDRDR